MHTFKDLLREPANISLCFEKMDALAWAISPVIENAKEKLNDLLERNENFASAGAYNLIPDDESSTGHTITVNIHKKGHMTRKAASRETVDLSLSDITQTSQNSVHVDSVKTDVIPRMIEQLDTRFDSFTLPIYRSIGRLMDPQDWVTTDKTYGEQELKSIAAHFEIPLNNKGFQLVPAFREWKELKYLRDHKYLGVKSKHF